MKQNIIPCLWFADNNSAEAMAYYTEVFPNSRILEVTNYPENGAEIDIHLANMQGKILTGIFELNGMKLMCFDGGDYFRLSEAFSLVLECADQAEIDYYWGKLSAVKEAEQCGWCKDQFGVSWQIVPANMGELLKTDAQIKAMMEMKKIVIAELEKA
jgi:predicted 3-demethylubiquinone-9 3-methyltransferase (glyoxalase superfamily)